MSIRNNKLVLLTPPNLDSYHFKNLVSPYTQFLIFLLYKKKPLIVSDNFSIRGINSPHDATRLQEPHLSVRLISRYIQFAVVVYLLIGRDLHQSHTIMIRYDKLTRYPACITVLWQSNGIQILSCVIFFLTLTWS